MSVLSVSTEMILALQRRSSRRRPRTWPIAHRRQLMASSLTVVVRSTRGIEIPRRFRLLPSPTVLGLMSRPSRRRHSFRSGSADRPLPGRGGLHVVSTLLVFAVAVALAAGCQSRSGLQPRPGRRRFRRHRPSRRRRFVLEDPESKPRSPAIRIIRRRPRWSRATSACSSRREPRQGGGSRDLTGQVAWKAEPAGIVSVEPGGYVRPLAPGKARVWAGTGPDRVAAEISVTPPRPPIPTLGLRRGHRADPDPPRLQHRGLPRPGRRARTASTSLSSATIPRATTGPDPRGRRPSARPDRPRGEPLAPQGDRPDRPRRRPPALRWLRRLPDAPRLDRRRCPESPRQDPRRPRRRRGRARRRPARRARPAANSASSPATPTATSATSPGWRPTGSTTTQSASIDGHGRLASEARAEADLVVRYQSQVVSTRLATLINPEPRSTSPRCPRGTSSTTSCSSGWSRSRSRPVPPADRRRVPPPASRST